MRERKRETPGKPNPGVCIKKEKFTVRKRMEVS